MSDATFVQFTGHNNHPYQSIRELWMSLSEIKSAPQTCQGLTVQLGELSSKGLKNRRN